jgi:uracil-DNA glycosylase family 4
MQAVLSHLIEHIKDLKKQGVTSVIYDPQRLDALKRQLSTTMKADQTPIQPDLLLDDPVVPVKPSRKKSETLELLTSEPSAPKKRTASAKADPSIPSPSILELPVGDKQTQWEWLKERVLNCPVCNSHLKPGKKVVFGVGNIDADIFFCGEAPGADEEVQGEPFVGPAGQLLTKIIQAMGLKRQDVYIGNIMNWRPQMPTVYGNRPPTEQEIEFCLPYLKAQLAVVQPKVVVALGATAVNGLLGYNAKRKLSDCRGQWMEFEGYPLMVTFHPSYLLRNNTNHSKRMVWEDMMQVMEKLGLALSEKQKTYFL